MKEKSRSALVAFSISLRMLLQVAVVVPVRGWKASFLVPKVSRFLNIFDIFFSEAFRVTKRFVSNVSVFKPINFENQRRKKEKKRKKKKENKVEKGKEREGNERGKKKIGKHLCLFLGVSDLSVIGIVFEQVARGESARRLAVIGRGSLAVRLASLLASVSVVPLLRHEEVARG